MTSSFSFVARINKSSELKKITSILTHNKCNINKVIYNSKIDNNIVFFDIDNNSLELQEELKKSGFMLTSIQEPIFIKLKINIAKQKKSCCKNSLTGSKIRCHYIIYRI